MYSMTLIISFFDLPNLLTVFLHFILIVSSNRFMKGGQDLENFISLII